MGVNFPQTGINLATANLHVFCHGTSGDVGLAVTGFLGQTAPLVVLQGLSSGINFVNLATIDAVFTAGGNADTSYLGRLILKASDHTGTDREGLRVESDGTQALLGFYGANAVARPTLSYSRSGAGETAAVAAIRQALASLGLVIDSTTT
jgi:hypothetical protein